MTSPAAVRYPMLIRFLGCHHTETATARMASLLVNGTLALDAGALTSTLTSEEQSQIQGVLITHHHYDHVRDIPTLALGGYGSKVTLPVFGTPATLDFLKSHLLDGSLYPDFTEIPSAEEPRLRLIPLQPREEHEMCSFKITPTPVAHSVPAVGYTVTSSNKRSFFYTGDTNGEGLAGIWQALNPDLVIVETTFSDSQESLARLTHHMTPALLEQEVHKLQMNNGTVPRIIVVHMNPQAEEEIVGELDQVASRLGISITVAYEGMVIEV